MIWSEDERFWQARVDVVVDLEQFKGVLNRAFTGSRLELIQSRDVVIVTGTLARAEHSEQLRTLLDTAGYKYVDKTGLAGVQQVQIEVRVAEVSRTAIRALAFNAFQVGEDAFGAQTIGSAAGGALNPVNITPAEDAVARPDIPFVFPDATGVSPAVTLFGGLPDHNFEAFVLALAENQYLRLLAEPTLVALTGEEASFLAGGEFPVPIVQGAAAGGNATITIEYKEFGVRLAFRPTVLGDGSIRLKVAPEVSELTDTGAVEIQGFRIPSIVTRRAETTLELKSGESFAMAGLLSSRQDAVNSGLPYLKEIPVLGALFRSVRYRRGETELVVLCTATLVEPLALAEKPPLPGSIEVPERDWEVFLKGSIEGNIPADPGAPDPAVFKAMGLDRLKGPGAWTDYDSKPARYRPSRKTPAAPAAAPGAGALEEEPSAGAAAEPEVSR
jgi:pilus assembly protein CpaC